MKDYTFDLYTRDPDMGRVHRGRFETVARTLEEAQADFRGWIRKAQAHGELNIPGTLDGWEYSCQVRYQ